ncbi:hypothetical protein P170DRAFT_101172 [Aspergillus steynii IBT 23096]|uniref:Uncharacterized protein n=1 Tax=Aspergillus steynii IBT 23096 TaxID=1392250 RepID=A0A2I2GHJ3_9EURO|nr:uncharacterized protein P170DRAFT_101172 [Aspergillus steynii IBT 23096]PLB52353.1 hypothetical protein P170DRAFT_101172 [Aspergillus steynii IBT 23096]
MGGFHRVCWDVGNRSGYYAVHSMFGSMVYLGLRIYIEEKNAIHCRLDRTIPGNNLNRRSGMQGALHVRDEWYDGIATLTDAAQEVPSSDAKRWIDCRIIRPSLGPIPSDFCRQLWVFRTRRITQIGSRESIIVRW